LRGLEQRQSCNEIEDLDEQLGEIRTQLKEYYKQRMCSHRQIQSLDEELNDIIQDFQ
jgi:chromosome segregation ATPase